MTNHSPRTMVPLKLCYAWTIWKAQGQTIRGKVVVDLGKTEKEHGLSYTAFSRVTRFNDIGIVGGLSKERLILVDKVQRQSKMTSRLKEEKRLRTLVNKTKCLLKNLR